MTKEQQRTLEIAVCNYLPYGVKYKYFCPYDNENDRIGTIEGIDHLPKLYLFDENGYRVQLCKTAMLLLRPLSDLTKEITHNGETFVPIVEMARLTMPNISVGSLPDYMDISSKGRMEVVFRIGQGEYFAFDAIKQSFVYGISTKDQKYITFTVTNQLGLFDLLNEWKFDYRGLINGDMAISVHDLPENPYE